MRKNIKNITAITFAAVMMVISSQHVLAQSSIPLTVGPARQQLTINPGETANFAIKYYNQSEIPLSGAVNVADFVVDSSDGSPRIIDNIDQANPKFTASKWVTLSMEQITIAPNDRVIVTGSLSVPKDARPGGRYVSVYFEPSVGTPSTVGTDNGATGVSPRIASLLYIRVNGPITENAFISNMFAKSFYEYGPIEVTAHITNSGDYHVRPRGVFTLTNPLGGVVEQSSLKEANIFPDALRIFTASVGEKWMMGQYKITLNALYGEKAQVMERSVYVWVFPWRVALVVLLTLIILGIIAKAVYKNIIVKEASLEEELSEERKEIEKLKKQLGKRE
ncbi:MAG: hypothetical protein NTV98_02610 [Candidatus Roizmanbacteria bacterium]|nr:hypothetical protein [Candidatus Roizmanbacteria bacterium]